ncbi:unnamed protein product [Alternaria alternata]
MAQDLPHHQHISGVSTQNHSQAFVGSARDVYFASPKNPQEAPEQAAVACRNALFLTDPHVDRENLKSEKGSRVAGTCEWITHDASYRAWLNSDGDGNGDDSNNDNTRLLWISGGPGKGKTMMSVFLTEELESYTARIPNAELAFFFCSAQDDKHNTGVAVLRGLVQQILDKHPQLIKHALPHFETPERTQQTLASLETLWIIFSKLIADAELGRMFCVIDGLDECHEDSLRALVPRIVDLLSCQSSTQGSARTTIAFKLAIISREIHGLHKCIRVQLDPDNDGKVARDIERVISTRVNDLSHIPGFDDAFRRTVQTALLQRAEGTFLWVGFAVHQLSRKQTCSEISVALKGLPSGLPAIYSRMLLQIPAEQRQISSSILRWVTLALRPLELQELAVAVGVQSPHPFISREQAISDKIALCGPLLKVQDSKVSLVHQSARDYLLHKEEDSDAVPEAYRIRPENMHLEIVQSSLNCVMQSGFQQRVVDLRSSSFSQESPLLEYAAVYWPEHARGCGTQDTNLFRSLKHFLETKHTVRRHWWAAYRKDRFLPLPESLPLLHMLCYLGFEPLVQAAVAWDSWRPRFLRRIDREDSRGNTALQLAVQRGNEAVVQLLVKKGADVKAKDNDGWTVLHSAARGGTEAVVRLLVEKGADVNANDKYGKTALHFAAEEGNEAIVRLLVNRGADVKAKDNDGWTVLHLAARGGNEAIVRLLVNRGADVKAKDNDGWTVLHLAARGGNEAIVRLLVDRGADGGNEAIVRLLVDRGADVKAKDKYGNTALHFAAEEGNEAMVRLLVEKGADVNANDKYGKTALHFAAEEGNEAIVRLLVDRGADVKAKGNDRETVLHLAARRGNEAIVRLLVDRGADVKAKDKYGKTALHSAAWGGNEAMVRLLVNRGADVKAKDKYGNTALHSAAWGGNEAIVRLLVNRGADVKAKDSDGWTVLHSAARGGTEAVVRLLVEKGADVNANDKYGKTALHFAAEEGNEAIVRLLVDRGADVKAKDNDKRTAL